MFNLLVMFTYQWPIFHLGEDKQGGKESQSRTNHNRTEVGFEPVLKIVKDSCSKSHLSFNPAFNTSYTCAKGLQSKLMDKLIHKFL